MTESEMDAYIKSRLPEWAIGLAEGNLVLGAQLPTRDGRRMGNAHIIKISPQRRGLMGLLYLVLTDAGNTIMMLDSEVRSAFHDPIYVSDVQDVINKFWRGPGSPLDTATP